MTINAVSIVIPTYNRPQQLKLVIEHILASDVDGIDSVEIVVVDDGSSIPANSVVESFEVNKPFTLKYLYQENSGPAKARNNGFQVSTNQIVLFVDDDILIFPNLIKIHLDGHSKLKNSVIFGVCPFITPVPKTSAFRYLEKLYNADVICKGFDLVEVVASGNLSVQRNLFSNTLPYMSKLRTPAAEEFEFEFRLNNYDIPIYLAHEAVGWHLQPATIEDKCKQEYKYGVGAAEAILKVKGIEENEHISNFAKMNGLIDLKNDELSTINKKIFKSFSSIRIVRSLLLRSILLCGKLHLPDIFLFSLYRFICGTFLFAGYRNGLKEFKGS